MRLKKLRYQIQARPLNDCPLPLVHTRPRQFGSARAPWMVVDIVHYHTHPPILSARNIHRRIKSQSHNVGQQSKLDQKLGIMNQSLYSRKAAPTRAEDVEDHVRAEKETLLLGASDA